MENVLNLFIQRTTRFFFWLVLIGIGTSLNLFATVLRVPNDYSTISAAIAAASPYDTIRVYSNGGVPYAEHVNVTKSLVLIGTNAAPDSVTTIVAPTDFLTNNIDYNYSLPNFSSERTIVHIGDSASMRVEMRGFIVDGNRAGPGGISYSAILAESCVVVLDSNTIKNVLPSDSLNNTYNTTYNGRGIHVRGSGAVATISDNQMVDVNRYFVLINATEDTVTYKPPVYPSATVTGNTITGKGRYNGAQKGVWFNNGAWGTISRNVITNIDYVNASIEPERASGVVVRRGYINTAHRNIITYNTISNPSSPSAINNKGIYVEGIGDSIADNRVENFRFGIQIHNSSGILAARDTVTGGQVGFIVTRSTSPVGPYVVTIGGSPANKCVITGQGAVAGGFAIALSFRAEPSGADGTFLSTIPVDARYNDFGVYAESAVQGVVWDRADTTGLTGVDTVHYYPFYVDKIRASVKVFLQGPYLTAADTMNNLLRTGGYLASHFTGALIPSRAVDSINIELRNGTTTAGSSTRKFAPAWLMTDGTIRNFADPTKSYVEFDTTLSGQYHIVVRHRNHLAIMDSLPQTLDGSAIPSVYDFSTGQSQAYGTNPMKAVGTRFAMVAGDVSGNGVISLAQELIIVRANNLQTGYNRADVNMNGSVSLAQEIVITRSNNLRSTQVP
jgi:hypothetical protein